MYIVNRARLGRQVRFDCMIVLRGQNSSGSLATQDYTMDRRSDDPDTLLTTEAPASNYDQPHFILRTTYLYRYLFVTLFAEWSCSFTIKPSVSRWNRQLRSEQNVCDKRVDM